MNEIQEYLDSLTVYGNDPCADCGHARSEHAEETDIACSGMTESEYCQCVTYKAPARPAPAGAEADAAAIPR